MTAVHIINLMDRKDRWQTVLGLFHKDLLVPYAEIFRFDAIDTRNKDINKILFTVAQIYSKIGKQYVPDISPLAAIIRGHRLDHWELTRGAVGCFLSHLLLWHQISKDNTNSVHLICEDDLQLVPNMVEELKQTIQNPMEDKCEICLLGHTGFPKEHSLISNIESRIMLPKYINPQFFMGLHMYKINKQGALLLLQHIGSPNKQLDWQLSDLVRENKIRVKAHVRRLIRVTDQDSDLQFSEPCTAEW